MTDRHYFLFSSIDSFPCGFLTSLRKTTFPVLNHSPENKYEFSTQNRTRTAHESIFFRSQEGTGSPFLFLLKNGRLLVDQPGPPPANRVGLPAVYSGSLLFASWYRYSCDYIRRNGCSHVLSARLLPM